MTVRRLNRIFRSDDRAVIVALDHGLIDGPSAGFEQPAAVIAAVIAGGADAVLTSYGIARRYAKELSRVGLILRSDGASTNLGTPSTGSTNTFFGVEDALRLGADALVVTAMPGSDKEDSTLANLAGVVSAAHRWDVAVLAEMVPGGFNSQPDTRSPAAVAMAVRLGAELGADFIKSPYCAEFATVATSTFRPVVILGGSKTSERQMLVDIHAAILAGGAGVAIGRNVFQAPNPAAMTAAIVAIVHNGASVDDAMALIS